MSQQGEPSREKTCQRPMSDLRRCGRPVHQAPEGIDKQPMCLMHSADPNKDPEEFQREVTAILEGKSAHHRPKDKLEFTGFVFVHADFQGVTFPRETHFTGAEFIGEARFRGATFAGDVYFAYAVFRHEADFTRTTFSHLVDFSDAKFLGWAMYHAADFVGQALFSSAQFLIGGDLITGGVY